MMITTIFRWSRPPLAIAPRESNRLWCDVTDITALGRDTVHYQ